MFIRHAKVSVSSQSLVRSPDSAMVCATVELTGDIDDAIDPVAQIDAMLNTAEAAFRWREAAQQRAATPPRPQLDLFDPERPKPA